MDTWSTVGRLDMEVPIDYQEYDGIIYARYNNGDVVPTDWPTSNRAFGLDVYAQFKRNDVSNVVQISQDWSTS